jgi:hypothetical protein
MEGLDDHQGRAYSDRVALRILLVVVALVSPALTTLAHIDPPDPTWIGGYWDDDDFDSVVDSILKACAVEPASPADVGSPRALVARLATLELNTIPPPVATTDAPRGPPAALLTEA